MKLSLIIPCYNEAVNLPLLVPRCLEVADNFDVEIVLVDNGSTDNSPAVLSKLLRDQSAVRSVRVEVNQGYGFGILSGLRAAKGDILGWTHADMQTDPMDAIRGFNLFEQVDDPERLFVKGLRYGRPVADVFFTMGMSFFETLLLRKGMRDINAQPTMFSRTFFEEWSEPPNDFSLDLYAYYHAKRQDLSVKRFRVSFGKRAHGVSHWNVNWVAKKKFIQRTISFSLQLRRSMNKS